MGKIPKYLHLHLDMTFPNIMLTHKASTPQRYKFSKQVLPKDLDVRPNLGDLSHMRIVHHDVSGYDFPNIMSTHEANNPQSSRCASKSR